jgi:hypothetical protein
LQVHGVFLPDLLHSRGQVFFKPVFQPDAVKIGEWGFGYLETAV